MLCLPDCVLASAAARQPGSLPRQILGTLPPPRNWDTEALSVRPRQGDAYAPSSLWPSQRLGTQTPPALPLARSGICADPVCTPGGSTASGPHACTAETRARKPSREGCGACAVATPPRRPVVLGDPRAPPVPTPATEVHRRIPKARSNTHVIRGTCWTQCLLPSRRAGRERGEGREQCVADSHVRLARWLPAGRVGSTQGQESGATLDCHSGASHRPSPLPAPRAAPTSL